MPLTFDSLTVVLSHVGCKDVLPVSLCSREMRDAVRYSPAYRSMVEYGKMVPDEAVLSACKKDDVEFISHLYDVGNLKIWRLDCQNVESRTTTKEDMLIFNCKDGILIVNANSFFEEKLCPLLDEYGSKRVFEFLVANMYEMWEFYSEMELMLDYEDDLRSGDLQPIDVHENMLRLMFHNNDVYEEVLEEYVAKRDVKNVRRILSVNSTYSDTEHLLELCEYDSSIVILFITNHDVMMFANGILRSGTEKFHPVQ